VEHAEEGVTHVAEEVGMVTSRASDDEKMKKENDTNDHNVDNDREEDWADEDGEGEPVAGPSSVTGGRKDRSRSPKHKVVSRPIGSGSKVSSSSGGTKRREGKRSIIATKLKGLHHHHIATTAPSPPAGTGTGTATTSPSRPNTAESDSPSPTPSTTPEERPRGRDMAPRVSISPTLARSSPRESSRHHPQDSISRVRAIDSRGNSRAASPARSILRFADEVGDSRPGSPGGGDRSGGGGGGGGGGEDTPTHRVAFDVPKGKHDHRGRR